MTSDSGCQVFLDGTMSKKITRWKEWVLNGWKTLAPIKKTMGKTSIVFYAYVYVTILILVKHKKVCIFCVISNVLNFEIKKKRDCIFVKNGTQRLCKRSREIMHSVLKMTNTQSLQKKFKIWCSCSLKLYWQCTSFFLFTIRNILLNYSCFE